MNALINLKLVTIKRPSGLPAVVQRRNRLIAKIWEQTQLAKAQQEGRTFTRAVVRSVKDAETGGRTTVEVTRRVRPWWWTADNGKVCLNVKYGSKVIELAKGKTTVEIGTMTELVPILDTLKAAVAAGELDVQIEAISNTLRSGFTKK
ncbi:DUF6641 family protein [Noviherbaspirillum sp.]|uniref:DUF6641 family protein n=1 Tax=Noviherbaspirillum sp. TaxID=1926288 RepID=UPI002FE305D3